MIFTRAIFFRRGALGSAVSALDVAVSALDVAAFVRGAFAFTGFTGTLGVSGFTGSVDDDDDVFLRGVCFAAASDSLANAAFSRGVAAEALGVLWTVGLDTDDAF